ncbi:MAG: hypothetical protein V4681_03880 [Patescibacteria group bacterium]
MTHKVLITTSGVGQRLGELTEYTNKALVRIGTKPVISHIIESYPEDTHFVVTLGYFGEQVRDFIGLAYPKLAVEYVTVDPYEGPGSSLGRSMFQAKDALQCPFIFHACDTLVTDEIPAPTENWVGVFKGEDTSQYASWTLQEGTLQFHDKGAIDSDYIHIGLIGVHDFQLFWDTLGRLVGTDFAGEALNDCRVLADMIASGTPVATAEFGTWNDVGNVAGLQAARREEGSSPDDLYKSGETIFIFDTHVIKFFADANVVKNRAERGHLLNGFVPRMEGVAGNFYRYAFVQGDLYSHVAQPADFKKFLTWIEEAFWNEEDEVDPATFSEVCRSFYQNKTQKRIAQFLEANSLQDTEHIINGEQIPSLKEMLEQVDFDSLSQGLQSRFHGDFILDNILKTEDGYCLIDWRQDFGGLLRSGDRYYDLAKLNHNLTVNHRMINENLYSMETEGKNVLVDILRPSALVDCQAVLLRFLAEHGYDTRRVETLTALIWLNMAPLHHHPFNLFLYYFGKLHLWRSLQA